MPRIEQWSVVSHPDDKWLPPELCEPHLRGIVFGHPRKEDGKEVLTSPLRNAVGWRAQTLHTEYELGEPSPAYLRWRAERGLSWDPENPIRLGEGEMSDDDE